MSVTLVSPSTIEGCPDATINAWAELVNHLNTHFYHPDIQALEIALSVVASHFTKESPTWIFVNGPAGSGKGTVVITCCSAIEHTYILGDLTPRTFISGNKDKTGLLEVDEANKILLFKDFTTIISKRSDDQREIASQMREIYDGIFVKHTGMSGRKQWEGKITVIAATTPAIERAWELHRDFGERFLQVRWLNGNSLAVSKMARTQRDDGLIAQQMRSFTRRFFNPGPLPEPTEEQGNRIDLVSAAIAQARTRVIREGTGREILDVGTPEEPSRIARGLQSITRCHAALFNRQHINPSDLNAGLRVGLDTMPRNRLQFITCIPIEDEIDTYNLTNMSGLLGSTVRHQTDELEAIGVIDVNRQTTGNIVKFSKQFRELWRGVVTT